MTIVLNEPLSQISLLFVSAAMAFIALALVLFSLQLSKLIGQSPQQRAKLSSLEKAGFGVTIIGTIILEETHSKFVQIVITVGMYR